MSNLAKSRTPEYAAWESMIARCNNKRHVSWHDYGGRGIKVHEAWRHNFNAFFSYVGKRPTPKHTLDRIDNDGDYAPGNVRWATRSEQNANQRPRQDRNWRSAAKHAYRIVADFEKVLCSYTGAKYAITCDSCTDALLLACMYHQVKTVEIPSLTYCSVPMAVINAGGRVKFRSEDWLGMYQLKPYPIYDSARLFTSGMYRPGTFICLSFHWAKTLAIGRGGAILCDNKEAAEWFRRARFDGRKQGVDPKNDKALIIGIHSYLTPNHAAQGLMLMASMKEHNEPLPNSDYPDLSQLEIFK